MTTDLKETTAPFDPAAVLRQLPARPRLLALGEPTHGENTLLALRNDLFRHLVEQEGYRTIALESDCLMGLLVDDYVTTGEGDLDDVMDRGFSHEWGAFEGNRELVRWMRAHNTGRPAADQVRFAGADGPLEISGAASPRQALTALHGYLSDRVDAGLLPVTADVLDTLIGPDARWTEPAAMTEPARATGQSAEARELRLVADDLETLLSTQAPQLIATSSPDDWDRARLYGRTATGLLRYHFWMADTSPARMTWLLGVRDAMIAANLLAATQRGPTLAYAHNSHLQRNRSTMSMWGHPRLEWWGAGALVSSRLGQDYAVLTTALGTIEHQGVGAPPSDTVEGLLYTLADDRVVVDPRGLAAALADAPPTDAPPAARVSPWFGYAPLDPAHLADHDGLVFVRDVRPG